MKLYLILLKKTISDSYISTKVIFELSSRVFNNKLFDCYNNLMGRKRNETIMRGIREKLFFMTNLATTVDVNSKSTLMTLLFDVIVDKHTT